MIRRQKMEVLNLEDKSTEDSLFNSKRRDGKHKVHPISGIVLIALLGLLFYIAYYVDGIGPTPLMVTDENKFPDSFIAERAQKYLASLTEHGPRIVGSNINEEVTVKFFKRELEKIQREANGNQQIEVNFQTSSGSYFLAYKPNPLVNVYANIQNIIVRVKGSSKKSVLINAHYDSVPTSPGATDDGIMCAVMLEVLYKLSKSSQQPKHDIIFLFNGAEESILQASHAFITQHKWAASAKILVNLEAAGSGHKEILFQSGPKLPWLLKYYNNVPHPYAQAAGEEIFQSNLIPSDTDFRIFRDFGGMVGFDLAFPRHGYRYHTKYDDMKYIPLSSYQHAGANVLSLVKDLSNAEEVLASEDAEGKIVFYDILGLFMISYSQLVAYIINLTIVLISIGITILAFRDFGQGLRMRTLKLVLTTYGFILGGWLLSALTVYIIAVILDASYRTMSWYTHTWIVFGLYVAPVMGITFGSMLLSNRFGKQNNLSESIQIQIQIHLIRSIWTLLLFVITVAGIRSAYVFMIPIFFNVIGFAIVRLSKLQYSPIWWQVIYIISSIIPTIIMMYISVLITSLFVPISGRSGASNNPEIFLSAICAALTILVTSYYAPLVGMIKKPFITLGFLGACFIITIILVASPVGFPYNDSQDYPTPQRHLVNHISRTFKDYDSNVIKEDSGIYLYNHDRNSPHSVKNYVPQLAEAVSVSADCEQFLACGLAINSPRLLKSIDKSVWIPFEQPKNLEPVLLNLISKNRLSDTITRFNFTAKGPDHTTILLKAKEGSIIKTTSLAEVSSEQIMYIHYVQGKLSPLEFTVDVQHPEKYSSGALLDATISGLHVHSDPNTFTEDFKTFLKSFPSWTDVTPVVSKYISFVF